MESARESKLALKFKISRNKCSAKTKHWNRNRFSPNYRFANWKSCNRTISPKFIRFDTQICNSFTNSPFFRGSARCRWNFRIEKQIAMNDKHFDNKELLNTRLLRIRLSYQKYSWPAEIMFKVCSGASSHDEHFHILIFHSNYIEKCRIMI